MCVRPGPPGRTTGSRTTSTIGPGVAPNAPAASASRATDTRLRTSAAVTASQSRLSTTGGPSVRSQQ